MKPRTMPLRQAQEAAVAAMPELSGCRTPAAREKAVSRTRLRERGHHETKVVLTPATHEMLAWTRDRLGLGTRQTLELAVQALQRRIFDEDAELRAGHLSGPPR